MATKTKTLDRLKDPKHAIETATKARADKLEAQSLKKRYDSAMLRIEELSKHLEAATAVGKKRPARAIKIKPSKEKGLATAITNWSDWHLDEVVKPESVNGLNEYNPTIAEARVKTMVRRLLILVEDSRGLATVRTLLVGLMGDFISGWLHPELEQTNSMAPPEAMVFAAHMLEMALRTILENSDVNIEITDCVGNHGRSTKKQQHSNRRATSLEQTMYRMLERIFASEPRVVWRVESRGGYTNVVDVAGHKVRFSHGDSIKYSGGIGGMTIPVLKQIYTRNEAARAEHDFFGHLHRFTPGTNWTCNGSLVGYNAFAVHCAMPYQEPLQTFALLDHERGITRVLKLYAD